MLADLLAAIPADLLPVAGASLAAFTLACVVLYATPGPDMALIIARSVAFGQRAGLMTQLGIVIGSTGHVLAAAAGLSALIAASATAFALLKWLGAAYLLWLAFQILRELRAEAKAEAAKREAEEAGSQDQGAGVSPAAPLPPRAAAPSAFRLIREGALTNITNPKVAVFMVAFFPQFVDPAAGAVVTQILFLGAVLLVGGTLFNGAIALLAGRVAARLRQAPRAGRLLRYANAAVFAGLALRIAVTERG